MTASENPIHLKLESPAAGDGYSYKQRLLHKDVNTNFKNVMRWAGPWVQGTYQRNQVVIDEGWTMIANKATDDKPSPQAIGQPDWYSGLGDAPAWEPQTATSSEVITGQRYTFPAAAYVRSVRVWIPVISADITYSVLIVRDPEGLAITERSIIDPTATGWSTISNGSRIIPAGSVYDVTLYAANKATSTTFSGNWNYSLPNNETIPLAGQITHSNKAIDQLWVSKTDDAAGDRSAELSTLQSGDTIKTPLVTWTITDVLDSGTYIIFSVTPLVQDTPGLKLFTFEEFGEVPIDYVQITNQWLADPNVSGVLSTTGAASMALSDDGYGVDLSIQSAVVSADWDVVAVSSE